MVYHCSMISNAFLTGNKSNRFCFSKSLLQNRGNQYVTTLVLQPLKGLNICLGNTAGRGHPCFWVLFQVWGRGTVYWKKLLDNREWVTWDWWHRMVWASGEFLILLFYFDSGLRSVTSSENLRILYSLCTTCAFLWGVLCILQWSVVLGFLQVFVFRSFLSVSWSNTCY